MFKLLSNPEMVLRIADGARIPRDPSNLDYVAFLTWQAQGNTPQAADPPPPPTQDMLDVQAANTYAKLVALRNMTPAQVMTYIDANVNNLAEARDALKTLAIAVSILARRL